ncbi:hypothetical protein P7F88_25140 [Vibrio hannami]|uniref:hypothetical protein n=1 Tax=Vibrio hannami TaxID=2717094 RepID=UPI0024106699|nr:hypothetical protein [Vibrio hannami]MDG3089150.1 hypothetical protein [Vibrio hannami]
MSNTHSHTSAPTNNREELIITTFENKGEFGFAGKCTQGEHIACSNNLFTCVETYLVNTGIAHNVVDITPVRTCGDAQDFKVRYNKSA